MNECGSAQPNAETPATNASTTMTAMHPEHLAAAITPVIIIPVGFVPAVLITMTVMHLTKHVNMDAKQKIPAINALNVILKSSVKIRKHTARFTNLVVTAKHGKAKPAQ